MLASFYERCYLTFCRVPPYKVLTHRTRFYRDTAGRGAACQARDPHDVLVRGDDGPAIAQSRRHFRVDEKVLQFVLADTVTRSARTHDEVRVRIHGRAEGQSVLRHVHGDAPAVPFRHGAPFQRCRG